MLSVFKTLVKVNFNHSYFADGVFNALTITASHATAKQIHSHGLLLKGFKGGFYILYDESFAQTIRTREGVLNEKLTLQFTLALTDSLFYNYTADVPEQLSQCVYHFSNNTNNQPGLLHTANFVSAADILPIANIKEKFFVKPFAKLDMEFRPDMETEYYIKFKARSTFWRYILMSTYLQQLSSPAIIDTDSQNAFGEPLSVNLPDNKIAKAFTSGTEMQLSQYPAKTFQLAENYETGSTKYKVIIRALPHPDISAISRLPNNKSTNFSDIFIY